MKAWRLFCFSVVLVAVTFAGDGRASVEWAIHDTLALEASPLDVAVSSNGRWIFVLTEEGEVLVYSGDGKLNDTLTVGAHVEGIEAGKREDMLLLRSSKKKAVDVVTLDFIYDIDVTGSPFRGTANAPVVIAVFNDYQ